MSSVLLAYPTRGTALLHKRVPATKSKLIRTHHIVALRCLRPGTGCHAAGELNSNNRQQLNDAGQHSNGVTPAADGREGSTTSRRRSKHKHKHTQHKQGEADAGSGRKADGTSHQLRLINPLRLLFGPSWRKAVPLSILFFSATFIFTMLQVRDGTAMAAAVQHPGHPGAYRKPQQTTGNLTAHTSLAGHGIVSANRHRYAPCTCAEQEPLQGAPSSSSRVASSLCYISACFPARPWVVTAA